MDALGHILPSDTNLRSPSIESRETATNESFGCVFEGATAQPRLRRSCNSLMAAQFVLWKRTLKLCINAQDNACATVEGESRIHSMLITGLKTKAATFIENRIA